MSDFLSVSSRGLFAEQGLSFVMLVLIEKTHKQAFTVVEAAHYRTTVSTNPVAELLSELLLEKNESPMLL